MSGELRFFQKMVFVAVASIFISTAAHSEDLQSDDVPCPRNQNPLHAIFLIHGIGVKKDTFGKMDEALGIHLAKMNPQLNYCIKRFVYPTGNNDDDTYVFAQMLGDFASMIVGPPQDSDRISIIAHSQGGLISLIWMKHIYDNNLPYHPEFKDHVDHLVTLGTPFWGADITQLGLYIEGNPYLHTLLHKWLKMDFGEKELQDMMPGSHTIYRFFLKLTDPSLVQIQNEISKKVPILNIGGFLGQIMENDLMVPVPSTRMDIVYADDPRLDYPSGDVWGEGAYVQTHFAKDFIPVHAVHAGKIERVVGIPSLANVHENCIQDPDCEHPSFKYVLNFIGNNTLPDRQAFESRIEGIQEFMFDLNLILPDGINIDPEELKIFAFPANTPDIIHLRGHRLSLENQIQFSAIKKDPFLNQFRISTTGKLINSMDSFFNLRIHLPGFKSRTLQVKAQRTFATFVQVHMAPSDPYVAPLESLSSAQ